MRSSEPPGRAASWEVLEKPDAFRQQPEPPRRSTAVPRWGLGLIRARLGQKQDPPASSPSGRTCLKGRGCSLSGGQIPHTVCQQGPLNGRSDMGSGGFTDGRWSTKEPDVLSGPGEDKCHSRPWILVVTEAPVLPPAGAFGERTECS